MDGLREETVLVHGFPDTSCSIAATEKAKVQRVDGLGVGRGPK